MGWFSKKEPQLTAIHPDLKKLVKHAFTIKDENDKPLRFYEFETLYDMPARRFTNLNDYIEDKNRGIDRIELAHNLEEIIKEVEENSIKGVTNALIIAKWLRQRMEIANDVDLILRLISCAFFTEDEDLTKYDWDIGTRKIELFEKNGLSSFFLSEPIKRFWTSTDISKKDIQMLIEQRRIKRTALKELSSMGISLHK